MNAPDLNAVFSRVYTQKVWGEPRVPRRFYSGNGTDPERDQDGQYIRLLQSYVSKPEVTRVIELGCGDWEVSGRINWNCVLYTGYDVVAELIAHDHAQYSRPGINFICADLTQDFSVMADLLIVKDTFQHLPPSYCAPFVRSIPRRFKYNLITNDFGPNTEIAPGGYTLNDFSIPPFSMKCQLLLQWPKAPGKQTITLLPP